MKTDNIRNFFFPIRPRVHAIPRFVVTNIERHNPKRLRSAALRRRVIKQKNGDQNQQ
jgi:hypothetical protein